MLVLTAHTCFFIFFFNDTATTEIYTLSLHDALPILPAVLHGCICTHSACSSIPQPERGRHHDRASLSHRRSEEHTSELQSQSNLVCRLLLEKKKNSNIRDVLRQSSISTRSCHSQHDL